MKKVLKFILWAIILLIVAGAIAIFIFIKNFDLNKYKTQISQIVYEQTERNLSLNGHIGVKLSFIPTIELNDVALSNTSWAKEPNMIEAKTVDVTFSILPLLKKEIVVDKIYLNSPNVYLSVNEQGLANWDFSKNTQPKQNKPNEVSKIKPSDIAQGAIIASVFAKNIKIENGEVIYENLQNKEKHELQIKHLILNAEDANDNIKTSIDVVYNNNEIKGDFTLGAINLLLQNADKYPVKGDVKAFGATAQFEGFVSEILSNPKYEFNLKAINPSGNYGMPDIKTNLSIKGNMKNIALNIVSLNVASNEIKGTLNASLSGKKPYIEANFNSNLLDLNKIIQKPEKQASFNLISNAYAASFVPATPLDLSFLSLINSNINLDVKKLLINDMSFDDIKANIVINEGNAKINIKDMIAGNGNIQGSMGASITNSFVIDLIGKDVVLQNFVKNLAPNNQNMFGIVKGGKTNFTINLSGTGQTLKSIVENLSGQAIFVVGESRIQTGSLKYLSGDFVSQILRALKLKTSDRHLDVSCAVLRSDITNGKAIFPKGIAFKSDKITIVSDGSVNLKNDKIDFSIKPFNGKLADTNVAQAISSMLKVTGTINQPRITIDNSSIVKNVVGFAATGPAFLGSQLLLDVDEYPCYTALKGTSYQNMFPAPSGVKAAGQSVYQGASDIVSDGMNLVNDAAKGVLNLFKGKK